MYRWRKTTGTAAQMMQVSPRTYRWRPTLDLGSKVENIAGSSGFPGTGRAHRTTAWVFSRLLY